MAAFATWPCSPTDDWSRPATTAPCLSGIRSGKQSATWSDSRRRSVRAATWSEWRSTSMTARCRHRGRDDDRVCNIGWNRALGRRQAGHPRESRNGSNVLGGLVGPAPPPDRRPRGPDRHLRRTQRRASGVAGHLVGPGEASVPLAGRPRAVFPGNERGCGLCGPDRRRPANHPSPRRVRRQVRMEERPGEDTAIFRRGEMTQVRSTGFSRKCAARPPEGGTTNGAFPTACSISSAAATKVPVQAPAAE